MLEAHHVDEQKMTELHEPIARRSKEMQVEEEKILESIHQY